VATVVDARLLLMVTEAYRHGKAIGAWGEGGVALGGRPARGPHRGGVRRDSGLGAAGRDTPARGTPCLGPSHPCPLRDVTTRGRSTALEPPRADGVSGARRKAWHAPGHQRGRGRPEGSGRGLFGAAAPMTDATGTEPSHRPRLLRHRG
jgi:hypothetical protein